MYVSAFPNGSLLDRRGRSLVLGTRCEMLPNDMAKAVRSEAPPGDGWSARCGTCPSLAHPSGATRWRRVPLRFSRFTPSCGATRHPQRKDIVPAAIDRVRERPTPRPLGPLSNADVNCKMFTDPNNGKGAPRWMGSPVDMRTSNTSRAHTPHNIACAHPAQHRVRTPRTTSRAHTPHNIGCAHGRSRKPCGSTCEASNHGIVMFAVQLATRMLLSSSQIAL